MFENGSDRTQSGASSPSSEAASQADSSAQGGQGDKSAAAAPAIEIPKDFAYAKDGKLDFESWSKDAQELASLREVAARRAEGVPEKPDGYQFDLPKTKDGKDYALPDGTPLKVSGDDPRLSEFRSWAHEQGLSQAQVNWLLGFHAQSHIGNFQTFVQDQERAAHAEIAQLADPAVKDAEKAVDSAVKRVESAQTWLASTFGDLGKTAAAALPRSAALVQIVEALRDGGADFSPGIAKPNGAGKPKPRPQDILYSSRS